MSGETSGPARALGASDPRHFNRNGAEAFDGDQFEYDPQRGRRIKPIGAIGDATDTADAVTKFNSLLAALRERGLLES
jgi:hypothetical protein